MRGYTCQSRRNEEGLFLWLSKNTWRLPGISLNVCVCACTGTCGSACSHVWLTFSLAQFQWVTEANRRWRLRRQTNYQQVISSSPTRSIHVFVQVCQSVCLLKVVALMFSDDPLINMIVSTWERKKNIILISPCISSAPFCQRNSSSGSSVTLVFLLALSLSLSLTLPSWIKQQTLFFNVNI